MAATNGTRPAWQYRHRIMRHKACNRRLFDAILPLGASVRIRCPKCGVMVEVRGTDTVPVMESLTEGDSLE